MKIYVASSWRNPLQPMIVSALKACRHEVYDFRNPLGQAGFGWEQIDPRWETWDAETYRRALDHPLAVAGYAVDITALRECEAVVYVLPCGRSASWEFGYAMGQGKKGYVVQLAPEQPELMFREATILTSLDQVYDAFEQVKA